MRNYRLRRCGNAFVGIGIVLLGSAIAITVWPKSYAAAARLSLTSEAPPEWRRNAAALETLRSDAILFPVMTNLDLCKKWAGKLEESVGVAATVSILKSRLNVRLTRNSRLIEIEVTSRDPSEAAMIANETARVFQEWEREQSRASSARGIQILEKEWLEVNAEIRRIETEIGAPSGPEDSKAERQRKLDSLKDLSLKLERRIIREKDQGIHGTAAVRIIEPAVAPTEPIFPSPRLLITSWFLAAESIVAGVILRLF